MKLNARFIGATGAGIIALLIAFGLGFYLRVFQPVPNERLNAASTANEINRPCIVGVDDHRSDLCAQWKAADAARSSADAAWLFGFVGSWIGMCTLMAAGLAAKYARDAALEGKKAADAATITVEEARHANAIARNIDRPWIAPSATITAFENHDNEVRFKFDFIFKNVGKMAAESVELATNLTSVPQSTRSIKSLINEFLTEDRPYADFSVIIPDGHLRSELRAAVSLTDPSTFGGLTPRVRIAILAICRYKLPGDHTFKYSATSWYLRNNGPRSLLPPNAAAANPSILLSEFPTMKVNDFELIRSIVSAS